MLKATERWRGYLQLMFVFLLRHMLIHIIVLLGDYLRRVYFLNNSTYGN